VDRERRSQDRAPALRLAQPSTDTLWKFWQMSIARAVQKYGMVVDDRSASVHFNAQDPVNLGSDPYPGAVRGQDAQRRALQLPVEQAAGPADAAQLSAPDQVLDTRRRTVRAGSRMARAS
jgi:hypothetical protein